MKIGPVEIRSLTRMAPMAGITNAPFRLIVRECGSGLTTSEEMDAAALLMNHPHANDIAAYYPEERPLAMQLAREGPRPPLPRRREAPAARRRHRGPQHGLPHAAHHRQGQGRRAHARRGRHRAHPPRHARRALRAPHRQDPRRVGRRAPQRRRGGADGRGRGRGRDHGAPAHARAASLRQGPVGDHRRGGGGGAHSRHRERRCPLDGGRPAHDGGHRLRLGHDRPGRPGPAVDLQRDIRGPDAGGPARLQVRASSPAIAP